MNSRMKRFQAISFMLLVVLNSFFTVAQTPLPKTGKVYTDYGLESDLPIPSRIMRSVMRKLLPRMRVSEIRRSLSLFPRAGGIMFDAAGQPCAGLANARLRLGYDRTKPDGQRLTLHTEAKAYTVGGVYDRDLGPIAEFVNDRDNVLTNVQSPDEALRQSCPPPPTLKIVTLHPAFRNTRLGMSLIAMDTVPWNFSKGKRWNSEEPLPQATVSLSKSLAQVMLEDEHGYDSAWPELWVEFINAGQSVLKSMDASQKKLYAGLVETYSQTGSYWESLEAKVLAFPGINKPAWNLLSVKNRRILLLFVSSLRSVRVSNFNDDQARPSFCTQASTVSLDGTPQLEFIAPQYSDNYTLPDSSHLMTENMPQLRLVDQEAYDGLIKIYRLGGLFRYVKQQSPLLWKQFLNSLPPKERRDTYAIICPACKKEEVEEWLTCVESKYPSETAKAKRR